MSQLLKTDYSYDWAELAFASKKSLKQLEAVFIAAPRYISEKRFAQLVKEYLPKGNIVLGIAKEPFVLGFEGQPHFATLEEKTVQSIIRKVNSSSSRNKIYTLRYFQRELNYIVDKVDFCQVILVNGSWQHVFHSRDVFYTLVTKQIPYKLVSPFVDEPEAQAYQQAMQTKLSHLKTPATAKSDQELLASAYQMGQRSYDYNYQTGAVLAKPLKKPGHYKILTSSWNRVVPYETYAMHFGASREINFSPTNDLNHYDTVHAEVMLFINAAKEAIDMRGLTLCIPLLPCPVCARMIAASPVQTLLYAVDHSNGYAVQLLTAAGKTVRQIPSPKHLS